MSRRPSFVLALCALLVLIGLSTSIALAQCSLSGATQWQTSGSGQWTDGGNWSGGAPTSSTNTCITNGTSGDPTVVNLTGGANGSVNNLQLGGFDTLNIDANSDFTVSGNQIINAGQININSGGGANALLELDNNVTLSGAGTLTLANSGGGAAIIYQEASGLTLTNQSTIDGAGTIGFNGLSLINQGTVDANASGQTLVFESMTNGINNAGGLLEATGGATLNIDGITVAGGGTLTATTGGTVLLVGNTDIQGGTLNNIGGTLGTLNGNSAFLDGSTSAGAITINGTYTNGLGSTTYILGTINNNNNFQMNAGGGANSVLIIDSANVTLQGGGTVTMSNSSGGGADIIYQAAGGLTLTNVNNTIEGAGTIGFNGLSVVNEATINANLSGQTLTLDSMTNGLNNTGGTLEASNGGTLSIDGLTVNNSGANITANAGSTVQLVGNTTIQGGTLNNIGGMLGTLNGNSAFLDGSTSAGAITINGTYTNGLGSTTYFLGTINNNNNFQMNAGGGSNSALIIDSANVTLQGGGTVTMSNSGGSGVDIIYQAAAGLTLTNVNNTIEGAGTIGFNGLTVVNEATIDANVSGQTLTLDSMSGGLTNTGIVEASNGGTLSIAAVTVNNAGGSITANAGSTVQLVANTTIQGGTLTNNGTFFGTPDGNSAILDGSTAAGAITINGTYTNGNGSTTYLLGTINNNNNFLVTATGNGNNSELLIDSSDVMLQGGGTLTLSTASGGGDALLLQAAGGLTLTNVNNTIQGEGIIGFNGLTLVNEAGGTINANSMGGSLINTLTIESAPVTNQGLMEATNNGTLYMNGITINNQGGNITANGAGASVELVGDTTIQGGTLTNNGGAFFGTPNGGNAAILDGSTVAGAVTINGTFTNGNNSTTYLLGTINNQGNILLVGGGDNNSNLEIDSANVTLTGGGTVTLSTASGGGSAYIYQAAGGETLENVNNTIQGVGIIGDDGLSLLNDAAGTILANVSGQTLTINGGGTVTNNGTFQANAGSTLLVENVNFTNFSGNTLTGGTYNVYGTVSNPGTMQLSVLGNTGGEIVNNAATVLLDGPNSNVIDGAGMNALSNFQNNEAAGSFTIQDGRDFSSSASTNFSNAGTVSIGSGSTFTTPGSNNYIQSGGSTKLDGMLVAGGNAANFNGGTLYGDGGTINANVLMAGAMAPAAAINGSGMPTLPGMLSITGNYTQTAAGIFNLGLGGLNPGTQFGLLNIGGSAFLNGTLNVSLLNGFLPTVGESFTFMTTGGAVNSEFATVNGLNIGDGEELSVVYGSDYVEITTIALSTNDQWLGGTGTWSTGSKWSIGVPQPPYDVTIYSGGNDMVTLDVGSTTVSSLAVGGATNGFTSELTDGGTAQTLTITNGLTVGQQGILDFTGNGSSITAATVTNDGSVTIGKGATLNLTNQPNGVTDVAAGASWTIGGNFSVGGVANTGFANLASIEGSVILENGQSQTIGTALTLSSSGVLDLSDGTTLNLTANVNNSGALTTGNSGTGGNTLNITGALTNSGKFELLGSGDKATISNGLTNNNKVDVFNGSTLTITAGGATNSGMIDVEQGSTLKITGDVSNGQFDFLGTDGLGMGGGNTLNITGNLTNSGVFAWGGVGDTGTITGNVINGFAFVALNGASGMVGGNLTNNVGGQVDVATGSTLSIAGNVTNLASGNGEVGPTGFFTGLNGTGGNTVTIDGTLTNSGDFELLGAGDKATINNGLVNNNKVDVFNGSTLTITAGGATNSGTIDVEQGSTLKITGDVSNGQFDFLGTDGLGMGGGNTLNITGNLTNSGVFAWGGVGDTGTITGNVINGFAFVALNGASGMVGGNLTNNVGGQVDVATGSTLSIAGNVTNLASGNGEVGPTGFFTGLNGTGGNTVTIDGTLTNSGNFELLGAGDKATLGSLTNNAGGFVDVEGGSTLSITGNVINNAGGPQGIYTSFNGTGNNTINIGGTLTNNGKFGLESGGDSATITGAVTNNSSGLIALTGGSQGTFESGLTNNAGAQVDLENASKLTIDGDVSNVGTLSLSGFGGTGGNTLTITGMLTNEGTFELLNADKASIGNGVTNNAGLIDLEDGSTLNITGNVTNNGLLFTSDFGGSGHDTLTVSGNVTNTNQLGIVGPGSTAAMGGSVTNSGTLFAESRSMITMASLTNSGLVDADSGSTLQINGDVTNSGTLATNSLSTGGGNTITVTGLLTNTPTGLIQLNGSMDTLQVLAGIVNSGTINVNNSSTIDPPFFNNLGTLNIDNTSKFVVGTGNPAGTGYIQLANGTLGEMISSTAFGVINVNGSALLAGTLDILLQGGFDPSVGSTYKFILTNPGQLSGVFGSIENDIFNGGTEKWVVDYDSADGYVELMAESNGQPLPEPGVLLVLVPVLAGVGFKLRRELFR